MVNNQIMPRIIVVNNPPYLDKIWAIARSHWSNNVLLHTTWLGFRSILMMLETFRAVF